MINKKIIRKNIDAHLIWFRRFESAISEGSIIETTTNQLSVDNECPFGKWLYTLTSLEQKSNNFIKVKKLHSSFHNLAGCIKHLIEINNYEEATHLLNGSFRRVSTALVDELTKWATELHNTDDHGITLDHMQSCIPVSPLFRKRFNKPCC